MLTQALRAMGSSFTLLMLLHFSTSTVASGQLPGDSELANEVALTSHHMTPETPRLPAICCPPARGWELGIESLYLKSELGDVSLGSGNFGLEQSSRVSLGYQLNDRWSIRSTIWGDTFSATRAFSSSDISGTPPTGVSQSSLDGAELNFLSVDGQLRRQFVIRERVRADGYLGIHYAKLNLDTAFGGGALDFTSDQASNFLATLDLELDSVGFTFGTDLWLPLKRFPHISIIGNLQGSVLGGNISTNINRVITEAGITGTDLTVNSVETGNSAQEQATAMWIGRAQVGAQYNTVWNDRIFFARGAFEFQSWGTSEFDFSVGNQTTQLSLEPTLYGVGFMIGMER